MSNFKFQKGDQLKDLITGFEGICTGRADYITGCNQYSLTTKIDKNSESRNMWVDENRLKLTKASALSLEIGKDPGGPQNSPSKKLKIN